VRSAARRWGPVTLGLIAVNVAMFVATAISAASVGNNPLLHNYQSPLFDDLALYPLYVDDGQWWRLLSAGFMHLGPVHLAVNMLTLLIFGTELERALGRWRYLGLYLGSLLGASAAIQLFDARGGAGASGAIYGLIGGLAVLMLSRRQDLRGILTLVAVNVAFSIVWPGISLTGHLGGLVAGVLITGVFVLARRRVAVQVLGTFALAALFVWLALGVSTLTG
jgi:membrane associated rhomboid family serine protease